MNPPAPPASPEVLPFVHSAPVPRKDRRFRWWAFSLVERIARDPEAARIEPETAAQLRASFKVFSEYYDQLKMPTKRTPDLIKRKNAARAILERMCRKAAQQIKHDDRVSFDVKSAIFRARKKRRKHVGPPTAHARLRLIEMKPGMHTLIWSSLYLPKRTGPRKPEDACAMQLFAMLSDHAEIDFSRLQYIGTYTRQKMKVEWPLEAGGLVAIYVGRWINAKGEEGPWSDPLPMQIAFGGVGVARRDVPANVTLNARPVRRRAA